MADEPHIPDKRRVASTRPRPRRRPRVNQARARQAAALVLTERRLRILELKKQELSFREIGRRMGMDHADVFRDWKVARQALTEREHGLVEEIRLLDYERLTELIRVYYPLAAGLPAREAAAPGSLPPLPSTSSCARPICVGGSTASRSRSPRSRPCRATRCRPG